MSQAKVKITGNTATITIPFDKQGQESGAGKSMVHASTNGFQEIGFAVNGNAVRVNLNLISRNPDYSG